jgi:hypothetical protein
MYNLQALSVQLIKLYFHLLKLEIVEPLVLLVTLEQQVLLRLSQVLPVILDLQVLLQL